MKDDSQEINKMLLGIQLNKFTTPPIYEFGRWKVFQIPPIKIMEAHRYHRNYQIEGSPEEKILVRLWLNDKKEIIKTRYYYLKTTDKELAGYIVNAFLQVLKSKYPIATNHIIKELNHFNQ